MIPPLIGLTNYGGLEKHIQVGLKDQFSSLVEGYLHAHIGALVAAVDDVGYDGDIDTWSYDWTPPNAVLFTVTIMTTVGYGHISPKSDNGISH